MMRKISAALCALAAVLCLSACAAGDTESAGGSAEHSEPVERTVLTEISLTFTNSEGDITLDGVLYDNLTARRFAEQLPLTASIWNPAAGFAKAFNLPKQIPDDEERTNSYELGGLAYWYSGPSVAIFYSDHLEQTIVRVVTIGKITSDVDVLRYYGNTGETVTVEIKESETK